MTQRGVKGRKPPKKRGYREAAAPQIDGKRLN